MRTDAVRNREKILDVARAALGAGETPTMAAVARAAGVGQGTMYRNFPTWSDLVMEVHRADMAALVDAAPALLEKLPPVEALTVWLGQLAEYGRIKKGLSEAMHSALLERYPDLTALDLILAAGRADGSIRADVTGEDVVLMVGFLWRAELTADHAARLLHVVVDGLRPSNVLPPP